MLQQDMNTRTGTRLDCPRPPDSKWIADSEGDYLDPQHMSPRFLPCRSRTNSTPGTVLLSAVYHFSKMFLCKFFIVPLNINTKKLIYTIM